MKITAIRLSRHRIPLDPPFHAAWDSRPRTHFDVTLVRVESDQGLVGVGSGDDMPGFAGHEDLFVGRDPRDLERHFRIIDNLSLFYGRCWPLDLALWDLAGKIEQRPCWKLLGGTSSRLPCYASSGSLRDPQALADLAQRVLERGFRAMKIRFQRPDWRDDVAALERVRAAVGDRLELMVDCNQGWRMPWDSAEPWTLEHAREVARQLEELDAYWMEEPLHRGDYEGMAALRAETPVRIAGGEFARELHDLRELIRQGCLDVLQPDAVAVGGLSGLIEIGRLARAHGRLFTPHTWGNGIALTADAHLLAGVGAAPSEDGKAGVPYLEFPYDPPEWTPVRRDFPLRQPLDVDAEGDLVLPETPGLGLGLDEARLAATEIRA